jgi:tetratricopeptide (TPR) repeat protein
VRERDRKYLWTGIIFLVGLAIRLIYFYQVKANFPGWDTPTIDPLYHDLWARQIASGDVLGSGPFFRAPLYAYLLGLLYAIMGPSLAAAKIIQHIIGAASGSVIFLFTDRYFDRRTAILSGFLAAFSWVLIYHEDELLLDSLLVIFSVLLIWSLMRAFEKQTGNSFILSGLVLGLSSITRPNYLALAPFILIWLIWSQNNDYKKSLRQFAIIILGALIFILPVTARNYFVGHDKVLIASQGGINFYIGNNQYADGASAVMPEFGPTWQYSDAEYLAKEETKRIGQEMKQSEVSSFYYDKGYDFIIKNPLKAIELTLKKIDYFWNSFEISNNQNLYFYRQFASITTLLPPLFFIISPLSLIGLWLVCKREKMYAIIPIFVISYAMTVIAFFVNSRFRLPVLPILFILASLAFWKGYEIARGKRIKQIAIFVSILSVLIILTNTDFFNISHESYAMSHFSLGNVYLKKGMKEKALEEYNKALQMADCIPKAHLNRGVIFFSNSDFEGAEKEFNLELEKCHVSAEAHNNLSVIKRLKGNNLEAAKQAEDAISIMPQYLEAYINRIIALRNLGQDSAAFSVVETLTQMFPDYPAGHYFKGRMLSERGRPDLAIGEFEKAISFGKADVVEKYDLSTIYASQTGYGLKPERVTGLSNFEMGIAHVKLGKPEMASDYFKRATELLPDFADAWINLALSYDYKKMYKEALLAFKKASDLDPENPRIYYNCALTLGKIGQLNEAAIFFRQALDLNPDFNEAKEKLKLTESLLNSSGK